MVQSWQLNSNWRWITTTSSWIWKWWSSRTSQCEHTYNFVCIPPVLTDTRKIFVFMITIMYRYIYMLSSLLSRQNVTSINVKTMIIKWIIQLPFPSVSQSLYTTEVPNCGSRSPRPGILPVRVRPCSLSRPWPRRDKPKDQVMGTFSNINNSECPELGQWLGPWNQTCRWGLACMDQLFALFRHSPIPQIK